MVNSCTNDELYHFGIKGMRWGIRRYQNKDGSLTPKGQKRYNKEMEKLKAEKKKLRNEARVKKKMDKLDELKTDVEKLKNGEDHLFLHDYLQFANRTVHCGRSLYYCLSRPNSASSNARGSSFSLPMLVLWNEVKNENVKCSFGWRFYILGVALHVYLECLKFGKMDINEFCEIKSFLKKYRFIYFFKAKATFKEKLKMVFKMYFPKLFLRIPR